MMTKKLLVLVLVCILVFPLGLTAKDKRGADLIVQKKDGKSVRGELIAVKSTSLLLLDRESDADVSINIKDVSTVRIVKKSKALLGAGIGVLIGAGVAVGYGLFGEDTNFGINSWGAGIALGVIVGIPAALLGALVGGAVGKDEIIEIEGKSDSQIQAELSILRKKARIPDYN